MFSCQLFDAEFLIAVTIREAVVVTIQQCNIFYRLIEQFVSNFMLWRVLVIDLIENDCLRFN